MKESLHEKQSDRMRIERKTKAVLQRTKEGRSKEKHGGIKRGMRSIFRGAFS